MFSQCKVNVLFKILSFSVVKNMFRNCQKPPQQQTVLLVLTFRRSNISDTLQVIVFENIKELKWDSHLPKKYIYLLQ